MRKTSKKESAPAGATPVGERPPMPAMLPTLGDLTPAVIAWFKEHDPEEYVRRYIRPGHPKGSRGGQVA